MKDPGYLHTLTLLTTGCARHETAKPLKPSGLSAHSSKGFASQWNVCVLNVPPVVGNLQLTVIDEPDV